MDRASGTMCHPQIGSETNTMHFIRRFCGISMSLLAIAGTACEAPEGIRAARPAPPFLDGAVVGVTLAGEGRARLLTSADVIDGVAGTRAYLSTDGGLTISERQPLRRVSNEPSHLILTNLTAGTTYTVHVVAVTNIGIESEPNDEGPLAVEIPAVKTDDVAPLATDMSNLENHGDAVAVRWFQNIDDTDVYGYIVERSVDGGTFEVITPVLLDSVAPQFRDLDATTPGAYQYRVVVEDLSGNRSAPSTPLSITVQ
jgi:hypothetical protein